MAQAQRIKTNPPAIRVGILRFFNGILREISFWLMVAIALGMIGALATFNLQDPAWTQTADVAQLHNLGGTVGAWFADVTLYFFGYPAVLLPLGVAFAGWRLFKCGALLELDAEIVLFRVLGFAVALTTACGLAALHLRVFPGTVPGDGTAGGLVGVHVGQFLAQAFGFTGGNLFMVALLLGGLTLMTGVPWLTMVDWIGSAVLKVLDAAGWLVIAPLRWMMGMKAQHGAATEPVEGEESTPEASSVDSINPPVVRTMVVTAESLMDATIIPSLPPLENVAPVPLASGGGGNFALPSLDLLDPPLPASLAISGQQRERVYLREVLEAALYHQAVSPLTLALGKDLSGLPVIANLLKMPHLLIAGTTGSGQSVAINALLISLLYKASPNEMRLILVDSERLKLSMYEGIPHLLTPIVTDMTEAAYALHWCIAEMERRYRLMATLKVRNIAGFNRKVQDALAAGEGLADPFGNPDSAKHPGDIAVLRPLPFIVVVINELADLMMIGGKPVEEWLARLAQKARAIGIHLLLATRRPSVEVITGLIKANIPTRIALQVSSPVDSCTILDQIGAEELLGHGDMLYLPTGSDRLQRLQGTFVNDREVHRVVDFLRRTRGSDWVNAILAAPGEPGDSPWLVPPGGVIHGRV